MRCLVVSDILALEKTWAGEIKLCLLGRRKANVLGGTAGQRIRKLADLGSDFYLINPDGAKISAVRSALLARADIQIIIVDEATTYRNAQTDVSKAMRAIGSTRSTARSPSECCGSSRICASR